MSSAIRHASGRLQRRAWFGLPVPVHAGTVKYLTRIRIVAAGEDVRPDNNMSRNNPAS